MELDAVWRLYLLRDGMNLTETVLQRLWGIRRENVSCPCRFSPLLICSLSSFPMTHSPPLPRIGRLSTSTHQVW